MIVKLTDSELALVKQVFNSQNNSDFVLLNKIINMLDLSHAELSAIVDDIIGSELSSNGFLSNYEPSEYGLKLEALLDKFNLARINYKS